MKKHFYIFGKKVEIKIVKDLRVDGNPCYGAFYPDDNVICIRHGLKKSVHELTLNHELVHALMTRLGLTQTNIDQNLQEIIAEGVGNFIADNFKPK